jgi:hypothetical protein
MMHMPVQIVRTGRKRKSGRRHPNGELVSERIDVMAIAIKHPERQGVKEADRLDQRAGTPLGRLRLRRVITSEEVEAARKYARAARLYHHVIQAPPPNAPSLDIMRGGGGGRPLPGVSEIQSRMENYNAAFEALYKGAGHQAARAVARVAVYDELVPAGATVDDLIRGLSTLATHYGLTNSRKSTTSRNRD